MSSLLDVRLGVQEPTILHLPPDVHSLAAAEEAIELADAYGVCDGNPLSESQRITLRAALGERADGSWAAARVGDFGPRQGTGKSDKIAARELAGLILFGERLIIHTAHEFPTANESFLRLVAVFENWDDLRKRVARIRYANGEQGIELLSGQRLKYRARTGGSGRGFAKADLIVYDEAQHLIREHVAASGPAKMANPNSQSWYAGSGGMSTSAMSWAMRRAALLGGGGRLAYTEATAERVEVVGGKVRSSVPDVEDVDAWYRAIPGLGRWVTEESVRDLLGDLGPEMFAREVLCVWDAEAGTESGDVIVDPLVWAALTVGNKAPVAPTLSVEISLDRSRSTIGSAWMVGGKPHLEVFEDGPGVEWVVPRLVELAVKYATAAVVVDASTEAGALIGALEEARLNVVAVKPGERVAACAGFFDAATTGALSHNGDPVLAAALAAARWKDVGDGARVFSRRKSTGDIAALYAVTLALHGLSLAPSDVLCDIW